IKLLAIAKLHEGGAQAEQETVAGASERPASPARARGAVEDGASWRTGGGRVQTGASEPVLTGSRAPAEVEARVHPTMIVSDAPIARVDGVYNAVQVTADAVGDIMLYGRGAGSFPTASAVV